MAAALELVPKATRSHAESHTFSCRLSVVLFLRSPGLKKTGAQKSPTQVSKPESDHGAIP